MFSFCTGRMATEESTKAMEDVKIGDAAKEQDDIVDPWNVQSSSETGVDYDKLISKLSETVYTFLCSLVSVQQNLILWTLSLFYQNMFIT